MLSSFPGIQSTPKFSLLCHVKWYFWAGGDFCFKYFTFPCSLSNVKHIQTLYTVSFWYQLNCLSAKPSPLMLYIDVLWGLPKISWTNVVPNMTPWISKLILITMLFFFLYRFLYTVTGNILNYEVIRNYWVLLTKCFTCRLRTDSKYWGSHSSSKLVQFQGAIIHTSCTTPVCTKLSY